MVAELYHLLLNSPDNINVGISSLCIFSYQIIQKLVRKSSGELWQIGWIHLLFASCRIALYLLIKLTLPTLLIDQHGTMGVKDCYLMEPADSKLMYILIKRSYNYLMGYFDILMFSFLLYEFRAIELEDFANRNIRRAPLPPPHKLHHWMLFVIDPANSRKRSCTEQRRIVN